MAHDSQSIAQKGEEQHRITIAFLVLAWVFILLRTFTRTFIISNFGWDDLTMVLAGMIFTIYCSGLFYLASNGGGTHVTSVVQMQLLIKWTIASEASYLATIMVLKISLGIFFARIVAKTWQLRLIYVTVAINVVSSLAAFFFVLLRCGPNLDAYITRQLAGLCTPRPLDQFFAYQQAAFTTLTDFVFATLPILILWNASMDRRSKISVGFILSLAALGCICSMIRFRYIEGLIQYSDFFWNAVNISLWSCIEPGAGIIAACLATLRPLLKRAFTTARSIRSLRSTASNTTTASPGGSADRKTIVSAGGTVTASSTCADSKAGPVLWKEYYGMEEQMFDLRSENGTTRDSTENMLAHHRNIDVEQSHCCAQVQRGTANSQPMSEGHLPHGSRGRSEKQDVWPHTITI